MHSLAEHRAGPGDDCSFEALRDGARHVLHLGGEDLVAAAVDHVLLAIVHADEASAVIEPMSPECQKPPVKFAALRFRVVPIPAHHGWSPRSRARRARRAAAHLRSRPSR